MQFSKCFFQAVCDYRIFLERKYPQKSLLKLIGDRYSLPSFERVMLYRGLTTKQQAILRKQKRISQIKKNIEISIDGFNVCRTIGSYLSGNPVFIGYDGFLRDVSELHRKKLKWDILERAVDSILKFLSEKNAGYLRIYFDTPISHSGKMREMTSFKLKNYGLAGEVETVYSPDYKLISTRNGIVCTADSNIIDRVEVPVLDLAHIVLTEIFHAQVFSFVEYAQKHKCENYFPDETFTAAC